MGKTRDIDDLPKNPANYTSLTPLWFLERAATVHPTRTSLVHEPVQYTWQDTYQRCRRFASALSNRSICEPPANHNHLTHPFSFSLSLAWNSRTQLAAHLSREGFHISNNIRCNQQIVLAGLDNFIGSCT
ncbi:ACYL-ACTIVATING ENZYME [Salix viminalis]|uniref:ACYL-ACTIVATING ENZYME n=1 Tax=Salix viminalis TaxID=40686 RepID=A0A9Q0QCN4_SALVM|nr:ACYL-ACTIVATING ENZYME [Salix viminalis]